jgi:hypothetical protein
MRLGTSQPSRPDPGTALKTALLMLASMDDLIDGDKLIVTEVTR